MIPLYLSQANDFDSLRTQCELCDSFDISTRHLDYRGIQIFKCHRCKVQFMNPQYNDSYLHRFYTDYLLTQEPEKPHMLEEQHYNLSLIEKYTAKKGRILDVGCGHGFLLKAAEERGWTPIGYDINPKMAEYVGQKMGVNILSGDFWQTEWPENYFDVITLCQVLEHVKFPSRYFMTLRRLLRNDGILFLSTPNIRSLSSSFKFRLEKLGIRLRRVGAYYDTHHHLWYYSPTSIKYIVKRFGFKILHTRSCRKFRSPLWKRGLQQFTERFLWHSSFLTICQKTSMKEQVFECANDH